jgi:hypothetical protein
LANGATHDDSAASEAFPASPAMHASAASDVSLHMQSPEQAVTSLAHCA